MGAFNMLTPAGFDGLESNDTLLASMPMQSYQSPGWSGPKMPSLGAMGLFMSAAGGVSSAVGNYFGAQAMQYQAKSQAVNMQYQSTLATINARQSEYQAESDIHAGQSRIANYTMQAGQQTASTSAAMAARGIRAGIGSSADVTASQNLVKDLNVYNINSNAVQMAAASRVQGTNYSNQANMDRVSAANAMRTANSISPGLAMTGSLLTNASTVANQWNTNQRMMMYAAQSGSMPPWMGGVA